MLKRRQHSWQTRLSSKIAVVPLTLWVWGRSPNGGGLLPVNSLQVTELGWDLLWIKFSRAGTLRNLGSVSPSLPSSAHLGRPPSSLWPSLLQSKPVHLCVTWVSAAGGPVAATAPQRCPGVVSAQLLLGVRLWVPACLSYSSPQTDLDIQRDLWMSTLRMNQKKLPFL